MSAKFVKRETNDAEEDGKKGKTHELDGLATHGVDKGNCDPVTWNCTGADENKIADGRPVEDIVHSFPASVANRAQDNGAIEAETIEGDVEEKP